jgi:glycosyltransferase involved in cell wall biosynthesis
MKKISFVIPVLNEQENIQRVYDRLCAFAKQMDRYEFEFVFTDNCSDDDSFSILHVLAENDSRVRAIRFSRNFGFQRSIFTGYMAATGDAIIQLDCDLEDPPELCAEFVKHWEDGYDIVYGVRIKRQESAWKTFQRKMFYRIIDMLSKDKLPRDAGDFRLIDRRVVDILGEYKDSSPYLRGTLAAIGFRQKSVEYERDKRTAGKSKFSFWDNLQLAFDGIMNHSVIPLRIASLTGFFFTFLSLIGAVIYLVTRILDPDMPAGFSTLVILILFSIGINGLLIGVMGEYIARIYQQMKSGPLSIIDQACNVSEEQLDDLRKRLRVRA